MRTPSPRSKVIAILALALLLSLLLLNSLAHGQLGDSIWLHASDGTDILIDGGPRSAALTVEAYL